MKNRKYDQYGLFRFAMAMLTWICHYNMLVCNYSLTVKNLQIEEGGVFYRIIDIILKTGIQVGGRMPICFFELSGLMMYRGYYLKIQKEEIGFKKYICKRIIRLYPMLLFSIVLMTCGQWIYFYKHREWWTGRNNDIWHTAISFTGLSVGTFVNTLDTVNGPIWYISVLMICYCLFWALIKQSQKLVGGLRYIIWTVPIIIGISINSYGIHFPFLTEHCAIGYIGFFSGVILGKLLDNKVEEKNLKKWASGVLIGFILLFLLFKEDMFLFVGSDVYWLAFLAFPSISIFIEKFRLNEVFFGNLVFSWLGTFSFYIYLNQLPVFLWAEIFSQKSLVMLLITTLGLSVICFLIEPILVKKFEKKLNLIVNKTQNILWN